MERLLFIMLKLPKVKKMNDKLLKKMKSGNISNPLHFRLEEHVIGDVHPYYEEKDGKWYMFHLEPGTFQSKLLTSKNMLDWTEEKIFFAQEPRAPYYVLGIIKVEGLYHSWFGQTDIAVCSVSKDLFHWEPCTSKDISINMDMYPNGFRDPFVVYDNIQNCFWMIGTAYTSTHQNSIITLVRSNGRDLTSWSTNFKSIIQFFSGPFAQIGEPEVTQAIRINSRWYIFSSIARRTRHHVGPVSYWIGPKNADIDKIIWNEIPERILTSEDFCAAQIVCKEDELYMWGWIPQSPFKNDWGGHLSFPLQITANDEGVLFTKIDESFGQLIRGNILYELNEKYHRKSDVYIHLLDDIDKFDLCFDFMNVLTTFILHFGTLSFFEPQNNIEIRVDNINSNVGVYYNNLECATLSYESIDKVTSLRIIGEVDILEIYINNEFALHAKIGENFSNKKVFIENKDLRLQITKFVVYDLK